VSPQIPDQASSHAAVRQEDVTQPAISFPIVSGERDLTMVYNPKTDESGRSCDTEAHERDTAHLGRR